MKVLVMNEAPIKVSVGWTAKDVGTEPGLYLINDGYTNLLALIEENNNSIVPTFILPDDVLIKEYEQIPTKALDDIYDLILTQSAKLQKHVDAKLEEESEKPDRNSEEIIGVSDGSKISLYKSFNPNFRDIRLVTEAVKGINIPVGVR